MIYLYQITNLINNKIYIGVHSTTRTDDRYMGSGIAIIAAITKYGLENFKKDILEFFNTTDAAYSKEAEIVNEEFLRRPGVYNLRLGGKGGWHHVNSVSIEDRINFIALRKKISLGEIKTGGSSFWSPEGRAKITEHAKVNAPIACLAALSDAARAKRKKTFVDIRHQQGANNSQFGKKWISHPESKEVKRIGPGQSVPEGWVAGRKGKIIKNI